MNLIRMWLGGVACGVGLGQLMGPTNLPDREHWFIVAAGAVFGIIAYLDRE